MTDFDEIKEGQVWAHKKKKNSFHRIEKKDGVGAFLKNIDNGRANYATYAELDKGYRVTADGTVDVPAEKPAGSNGNGLAHHPAITGQRSSFQLAPLTVSPKKELRIACPCTEMIIADEVTTWDELVERVERFLVRHEQCLMKNNLFSADLTPQEEATR